MEILELKNVVSKITNFSKSLDTLRRWLVDWKICLKKITRLKHERKRGRKVLAERWGRSK